MKRNFRNRTGRFAISVLMAGVVVTTLVFWFRRERVPAAPEPEVATSPLTRRPMVPAIVGRETAVAEARPPAGLVVVQGGNDLFRYVAPPERARRLEEAVATPSGAINYVRISREATTGKESPFWKAGGGGRIDVRLPDGTAWPVTLGEPKQFGPERFVSTGVIEGRGMSRVVLAYNEGELAGMIEDVEGGTWELRSVGDGVSQFFKVDPAGVAPCGGAFAVPKDAAARVRAWQALARADAAAATNAAEPGDVIAPPVAAGVSLVPEVRVLVAVSDDVAQFFSAASIQAQADAAIQIANNDLVASQVAVTLRLAGVGTLDYDENAGQADRVQADALARLADPTDGYLDGVGALRDQYAADVVMFFHLRVDPSSAGLAYLLDENAGLENETFAFGVIHYGYMTTAHITTHEIGHTLGCAHDRANSGTTTGAFPYSYGHRFTGENGRQYCTIMAYESGVYTRLGYFSNPAVTAPSPVSRPVGVAEGQAGAADNARTIRQTAFEVSQFRLAPQVPANAGTMVNVSTQAYIGNGPGEELIGGLVIGGSQPKRVLVRGIGPALGLAGVPGALADPVMRFYSTSGTPAEIAFNDNWVPAEVDAATPQSGATGFQPGSRDAAMVLTLTPGTYTANISGNNGTVGRGMVEVYEVGRGVTAGRIINLSTRGYVSKGQTMTVGFVIDPDPSFPARTKRVVLRAIGPSLPVANPLNDPMVTLYDATPRKILTNDDWTATTTGVDTSPTAKAYAASKIYEAGLAPKNRRDSAMMLDLPPGLYSAIVEPFSSATQPGAPGVAIVEVYEIDP